MAKPNEYTDAPANSFIEDGQLVITALEERQPRIAVYVRPAE